MPHDHHHHLDPGDRNMSVAVVANLGLSLAQIAGGLFAGSVALIADGVHNLSDAATLVLAFAARRIARRPADAAMTFGYGRAEVVAALVNYTTLIVISLWLAAEAVPRLIHPPGVDGWIVVILAALALLVNTATALLTFRLAKHSLNIRAAFLHNLGDAATSLVVVVAGGLILLYDWRLVDPLATLGISGWMLWTSLHEIRPVIRILMLGAPPELAAADVLARIAAIEGVAGVHHLHLWQIDEHETSCEAHLVVAGEGAGISAKVRAMLERDFGIDHATFAVETVGASCVGAPAIGHPAH